jgi:hypothetical protein
MSALDHPGVRTTVSYRSRFFGRRDGIVHR